MSWIFIEPSDVWFFRDGRPFSAGEGHTANTLFPPTPFTVQGALRSLILGHRGVDWADFAYQRGDKAKALGIEIGHPGLDGQPTLGDFNIQGPFLGRLTHSGKAELLTPLPEDAYFNDESYWQAKQPVKLIETERIGWANWPNYMHPLQSPGREHASPPKEKSGLLDDGGREAYGQGEAFILWGTKIFETEPRLGIAVNKVTGQAQDQMLYQSEFVRPLSNHHERYGLLVKLGEEVTLPVTQGVLALGGEARAAHFRILSPQQAPMPLTKQENQTQFKIVLQTPAWFVAGWQPEDGDWHNFFKIPLTANLKCVAVALGKPQLLGGWDIARNSHKMIRSFVPAGSVYYFEADEPISMPTAFTQSPPHALALAAQGFGAYSATSWQWLTK